MDLISHLTLLGGAADRATIVTRCGRASLDQAVRDGVVLRVARGRYALPSAAESVRLAATHGGTVSMRSAAQRHGWGLRLVPARPDITFPRKANVPRELRRLLIPHWVDLGDHEIVEQATSKRRTLVDCMRMLRPVDSLPILESAVRVGDVSPGELVALAESLRGRGRRRAVEVASAVSTKTTNPFESVLRAVALAVPGLAVEPQYPIQISPERTLHPDLADPLLGIVIEAESFEWHGRSAALTRDCIRYNAFTTRGWIVVRFSWYLVVHNPEYVHRVLCEVVAFARRANVSRWAVDVPA